MARKATFVMRPLRTQKRVLLVIGNSDDAARRTDFLRHSGYDVDSCIGEEAALTMSRTHSYDLIVLPVDGNVQVERLCRRLQRINPNSTVACLADCKKPIPSLPAGRLLWQGEPLEYFLARLDALSSTA
jgi:PleD family two-component response regulator